MLNQNLYIKSNYLYTCDCINKYNLSSSHQVPKIEKISLDLPLLNLTKILDKDISTKSAQIKSFLLFYLISSNTPFIFNSKKKSIKSLEKNLTDKINISFQINKKYWKYNFLCSLFIESLHLFEKSNLFNNNKLNLKTFVEVLDFNLTGNCFFDLNSILQNIKGFSNINPKELGLNLRIFFKFNKFIFITDKNKFIKNMPLFWISG